MNANYGYDGHLIFKEDQMPHLSQYEMDYLVYISQDWSVHRWGRDPHNPTDYVMGGNYREMNWADIVRTMPWTLN